MKRILSIILSFLFVFTLIPFNTEPVCADDFRVTKTDNIEGYTTGENLAVFTHPSFCGFGTGMSKTYIADSFAYSGSKSVCQKGRCSQSATVKIHNLFGRKLTKDDIGKTFMISFYVYADKESGVYKKDSYKLSDEEKANNRYTREELKDSTSSRFYVYMAGPDGQSYKYRTGTVNTRYYDVPWNEWTLINYEYTVAEEYLPTDSTEDKSDPYLESIRVGQGGNYSLNEALSDTIYIDDISVMEYADYGYYTLKSDDMESYTMYDVFAVKSHKSFSAFGSGVGRTKISEEQAHSGSKSICQSGRTSSSATIKALDLFGRELNATDVGKTYRISVWVYPDKEKGAYKESGEGLRAADRDVVKYTDDELSISEGTVFDIVMTGPDEDRYAYRVGAPDEVKYYSVPWNEWTELVYYYTVKSDFLPNGSRENKSDTYVNAIRIGQQGNARNTHAALCDTFYIDDLSVSLVGAYIDGGVYGNQLNADVKFTSDCKEEYARGYVFEYDDRNRLLGAKVGNKIATKNSLGSPVTVSYEYTKKSDDSSVYIALYGKDFSKPITPMTLIPKREGLFTYASKDMAIDRAKEMLKLSKAEYKDEVAVSDRVDKDNQYFRVAEDVYVRGDKADKNYKKTTTLYIRDDVASYLRFDLSEAEANSASHAYLSFYTKELNDKGNVDIYEVTSDWDENTVTYNTRPDIGDKITSITVEYIGNVYFADITSYVNNALKNNKKEINLCLKGDANVYIISKETTHRAYKPTIILEGLGMKEGEKKQSSFDYSHYIIANKKINRGTDGTYAPTPTRVMDSLKGYTPINTELNLNKYGSPITDEKYTATGFFRTELIDGRWWIIDPEGYKHLHTAVSVVQPARGVEAQTLAFDNKYGTKENWAKMVIDDLRPYGFNAAGPWGDYQRMLDAEGVTPLNQAVYRYAFLLSYDRDYNDYIMDVFDPQFELYCDAKAKFVVDKYADNPHIFGWITDNEPPASDKMLEAYLTCDPTNQRDIYNYYTAWEWFKSRHGEGAKLSDITDEDKCDWVEFVFDRYMNVCVTSIRKYDKNHMIIGPKLDKPHKGSFRAMDDWADIVGYDYYDNAWTAELAQMDEFYRWSGRPLINAEWYCKGADACTEETQLTNNSGVGFQATTQAERGYYYQNFVINMIESKAFVGWQWFRYTDNLAIDREARDADSNANKGVYTRDYKPWEELLSQMKMINRNIYSIADYFDK